MKQSPTPFNIDIEVPTDSEGHYLHEYLAVLPIRGVAREECPARVVVPARREVRVPEAHHPLLDVVGVHRVGEMVQEVLARDH